MIITLFLDMDGVLCNFDKAYRKLTEIREKDHKQFRNAVMNYKIFEDLEFMPDAQELLNHVSKLNGVQVEILTSMGTFDPDMGNQAKHQKMRWLDSKNIPYKAHFVRSKQEKAMYANPYTILIDDSTGCVKPFEVAGGHAILHTSSKQSIKDLNSIIPQIGALSAVRFI